ncbi:MAG: hypothetical protein KAH38_07830 [Candidatus Hydrogenedentes bacterium]|nr:hypothetical protein [Candidatus Hydrogenedentota bacterium]
MDILVSAILLLLLLVCPTVFAGEARTYEFDGSMSREVLDNYLSRSVTHLGLCSDFRDAPPEQFEDDVRMLCNMGAKFIGRAAYVWCPWNDGEYLDDVVARRAAYVHQKDPEMILQACIFETTHTNVAAIAVPDWVFEEFGVSVETRSFCYENMLYEDGKRVDHWAKGASVPDMSRIETRMWFYYRARRYIDLGFEAIHFGQVMIMDDQDEGHQYWLDMLGRVRVYAKQHARRHFLLCDAHTSGFAENGKLLFDFHSFPLRPKDVMDKPQEVILEKDYLDSIYGKSMGGRTPSGWECEHLPYLVELDNYGASEPGKGGLPYWSWGWDEITWFAHQTEEYRNQWLRYAWDWLRENDPNGWLQMPAQRCLTGAVDGRKWYHGNTRSAAAPDGFNQEETIKAIWASMETIQTKDSRRIKAL